MELLQTISSLFFSSVVHVVTAAPYFCMLLVGAFLAALLFNILHEILG